MGITEKIAGINLDPSYYIPSLNSTQDLKRNCSFSCYREKALLGSIDSLSSRSTRFFGKRPTKGLNQLRSEIQEELLRSDQIKIAAKEANNQLIPIYKEQIKQLSEQNKQIDKTLADKRFAKNDPVKFFQLEQIKINNNIKMCGLIEKINKLESRSQEVSREDKKAIAELNSKALYEEILRYKIAIKKRRDSQL